MELRHLLSLLPDEMLVGRKLQRPQQDIAEVRLYEKNLRLQPDVLYLSEAPLDTVPENLLSYSGDASNQVLLSRDWSVEHALEYIQELLVDDRRTAVRCRKIMTAFLHRLDLQDFVKEAAEIMENSLCVVDSGYHYIAKTIRPEQGSMALHVLTQDEMLDGEAIAYIRRNDLDAKLSAGNVVQHYNELLQADTLTILLRVHGIEAGHVMLIANHRKITNSDRFCFEMLADMIEEDYQHEFAPQSEVDDGAFFLIELLKDKKLSADTIQRRLQYLPFSPQEEFFVAVIDRPYEALQQNQASVISLYLYNQIRNTLRAYYGNQLVVLFTQQRARPIWEDARKLLQKIALENDLVVGVSNVFEEITLLPRFYNQAKQARIYGTRIPRQSQLKPVFDFQDYAMVALLEVCRSHSELLDFCHPMLLRLLDYDRNNGTDYMNTLYEYLENNCNTLKTANSLFIHKNTMLYRLDRIRSIIGNDLSDNWDRLLLGFSYRILFYLEIYRPPAIQQAWIKQQEQNNAHLHQE